MFGLVTLVMTLGCEDVSTLTPLKGQTTTPGTAQADSLILQLDAPAKAPVGTPIRLKLTLRTTAKEPVEVMLGGRPPFDFVVTTPDGAEVWRWSWDKVIQAILETRTLQPGERLEYDAEWPLEDNRGTAASPGRYLANGVLNMDPPEKLTTTARELVLTSR